MQSIMRTPVAISSPSRTAVLVSPNLQPRPLRCTQGSRTYKLVQNLPSASHTQDAKAVTAEVVHPEEEVPSTSYSQIEVQKEDPWFMRFVKNHWKLAAVGALCLAMAFAFVSPAMAARSGGRAGGSAFSSFSGGSSRGYSGAIGGGSRGFSGSMGGSLGGGISSGGSGIYSRSAPSLTRTGPTVNSFGWFYGAPYGGYGGGFGGPVVTTGGGGGGGLITILVLGVLAAFLYSTLAGSNEETDGYMASEKVSVLKLQVGLLGSARRLQKDLDRIAGRADTNTPSGLHFILQETILALLRNPDYAVYGEGVTSRQRGLDNGESAFNRMSMEERSKVKEETLVNVGGRSRRSEYANQSPSEVAKNELIVVTLLVAAEGGFSLPKVTSLEELKKALTTLGGISEAQTMAVEVMWTPQAEDDFYTKDDMMQDFPTLNNL